MKLYLAGKSALELLRYLRSTGMDNPLEGRTLRRKTLNDAISTSRDLKRLDNVAERWLGRLSLPIHAFVDSQASGTQSLTLRTHFLGKRDYSGYFIDLGHDICISSPQFLFVQMALKMSPIDTICLGMELCGGYSKGRIAPKCFGDPYYFEDKDTRDTILNIAPVTKVRYIAAFIERNERLWGIARARKAVRWLLDNSASPMETSSYLLFCLPRRIGGYGIPKPILNPEVTVKNPDGEHKRFPDLFWRGPNIDVEYNSDLGHSGDWNRYRDAKREVQLVVGKITVLPLTKMQLKNADEFHSFALGLGKLLGIQLRGLDSKWQARRDDLRRQLFAA